MLYAFRFFSSKCSLFHNAVFFGSCIIQILYTGCAEIKKNNSSAKRLRTTLREGTRWRSWLRHCAKRRKVAGSIPDSVTGIFHWHNPSGCTMALGSTHTLTEMGTRNIYPASYNMGTGSFPGLKCGLGVLLTTHPLLTSRSWKCRTIPLPTLCNEITLPFTRNISWG